MYSSIQLKDLQSTHSFHYKSFIRSFSSDFHPSIGQILVSIDLYTIPLDYFKCRHSLAFKQADQCTDLG